MKKRLVDLLFVIGLAVTQIVAVIFYGIFQDNITLGDLEAVDVTANLFRYPYF